MNIVQDGHPPIEIGSSEIAALKAKIHTIDPRETPGCPVCGGVARWFCTLDFSVSGNDFFTRSHNFAPTGAGVQYFRCESCRFLFSASYSEFTTEDFARFIYNGHYLHADPPFDSIRPARDAETVAKILSPVKSDPLILDYGGGSGTFARQLKQRGFENCFSFDPIYGNGATVSGKYAVITCFEVIEHVQKQRELAATIRQMLAADGVMILSTQVQPPELSAEHRNWWYLQPRNGHLSLHSQTSLRLLFASQGMTVRQLCQDLYLACDDRHPAGGLSEQILSSSSKLAICEHRNPLPQSDQIDWKLL